MTHYGLLCHVGSQTDGQENARHRTGIFSLRLASGQASLQLRQTLQHFVAGRNRTRVRLKRPLRDDHIDEFLPEINVGLFHRSREHSAETVDRRRACQGGPGLHGFQEVIVTDVGQAIRIGKAAQDHLRQRAGLSVRELGHHLAFLVHADTIQRAGRIPVLGLALYAGRGAELRERRQVHRDGLWRRGAVRQRSGDGLGAAGSDGTARVERHIGLCGCRATIDLGIDAPGIRGSFSEIQLHLV